MDTAFDETEIKQLRGITVIVINIATRALDEPAKPTENLRRVKTRINRFGAPVLLRQIKFDIKNIYFKSCGYLYAGYARILNPVKPKIKMLRN